MGTDALRLLLRVFVEVEDELRAGDVLRNVIEPTLAPHAGVLHRAIEHYWKIQEWFEITLELDPLYDPAGVYERLLALGGVGWTRSDDESARDAVWCPSAGSVFLAPEVRRAHLQLWLDDESRS